MKEPFAETLSQIDADLIEEAAAESLPVRRSGRRALRIAAIAAALLLGAGLWASALLRSCGGSLDPENDGSREAAEVAVSEDGEADIAFDGCVVL